MASIKELKDKDIAFGITLGGVAIAVYLIYKAIGDYQTGKRIENMDNSLSKLAGTKSYSSKILDKLTLKETTEKLGRRIEELV